MLKLSKIADSEISRLHKLISRKIWEAEKLPNFYIVWLQAPFRPSVLTFLRHPQRSLRSYTYVDGLFWPKSPDFVKRNSTLLPKRANTKKRLLVSTFASSGLCLSLIYGLKALLQSLLLLWPRIRGVHVWPLSIENT